MVPSGMLIDMLSGRTVGGHTVTSTKGTTQNDGSNDNPAFLDTTKKAFNVEIKWLKGSGEDMASASFENLVMQYNETFFDLGDQTIGEAEDAVTISLSGLCYGTVESSASDFTAGNNLASAYDCS
jgi:hypothetical protein